MGTLAFTLASSLGSGYSFSPGAGGSALADLGLTTSAGLVGHLDQAIDPTTLDYVRTSNGEWAQTADSRTAVMLMLETELGASPFSPEDGTVIKELLRAGDPISPEMVRSETERALGILVRDSVIADVVVRVRDEQGNALVDETGRLLIDTRWTDLASGSAVNMQYQVR